MKHFTAVAVVFALAAVTLSNCAPNEILENDGQYHPELWAERDEPNTDDYGSQQQVQPAVIVPTIRSGGQSAWQQAYQPIPVVSHQNFQQVVAEDGTLKGQYSYTDPAGRSITVKYVAGPSPLQADYPSSK
ncbi:uncharacterized protein LOC126843483 [Adelges cooleyi]|uniref:uncharacterized protein LOC126838588 n=1 Tax=Adelges cooleyi TaxID=133065 RepID=UPI00217F583D|nr:uncharacterized protein LOC126838588 [Adelges cooleyi]XP_050437001.1 uncharacterized protein LOC126843483 [Adelges cooleyi]